MDGEVVPQLVPTPQGLMYDMGDGTLVPAEDLFPGIGAYADPASAMMGNGLLDPASNSQPMLPPGEQQPFDESLAGPPPNMQLAPEPAPPDMGAMLPPEALGGAPELGFDPTLDPGFAPELPQGAPQGFSPAPQGAEPTLPPITGNFGADLATSGGLALGAAGAAAGAEEMAAEEEARVLTEGVTRNLAEIDEQDERRADARAQAEADVAEVRTNIEKIKSTIIKPNLSTGQQVGLAIAAIANGLINPRGKNPAVETALQLVQQDIEVQRSNLSNQREGLRDQMGIAKDRRYIVLDDLKHANEIRLAHLENMKLEIDAAAARTKSPKIRAEFEKAGAEIYERMRSAAVQHEQILEGQRNARGHLSLERAKFAYQKEQDDKKAKAATGSEIVDPVTLKVIGTIGDDVEGRQVRAVIDATTRTAADLGALARKAEEMTAKYGTWEKFIGTEEGVELRADYERVRGNLIRKLTGAALSPGEVERITASLIEPDKWWDTGNPQQVWANFSEGLAREATFAVRTRKIDYDFAPSFKSLRPETDRELTERTGGATEAAKPGGSEEIAGRRAEKEAGVVTIRERGAKGAEGASVLKKRVLEREEQELRSRGQQGRPIR